MLKQKGLTLVEVMIALLIISIVFMVLANTQITNLNVTRSSRDLSQATQHANDLVESAALKVFQQIGTNALGKPLYAIGGDPDNSKEGYDQCPTSDGTTYTYNGNTISITCRYSIASLPGDYTATVIFTGLYDAHDPLDPNDTRTMDEFLNEGLVRARIELDGPNKLSFNSYISCYDVATTPQLDVGEPCPVPYEEP